MELNVYKWAEMPRQAILDGHLTRTALRTNDALVTFNWFGPNTARSEPHSHPFDQLIIVVTGRLNVEIDGQILLLEPGSAVRVPPNIPHTAWPANSMEVLNIDVFAPVREDYLFLTEHQTDIFEKTYRLGGKQSGFSNPLE